MDARILKVALLATACTAFGASHRTENFVVSAPTPEMAQQIGDAAENFRKVLAIDWLGKELPAWSQPCPITAHVGDQMGAGGATSFLFERGEVYGWRMTIQGSLVRILDSVLPHEVTHTIFASHFRQPLPRWADEGACTTVEHYSERAKQHTMLLEFLRNGRGIAFGRMFAMKEYPHDVMPLYSQGYSLASFLMGQGGKQVFLNYLANGMQDENWSRATQQFYGYQNLGALQVAWLEWVRQGSKPIDRDRRAPMPSGSLVSNERRTRAEPDYIYRGQSADPQPMRQAPQPSGYAQQPAPSQQASYAQPAWPTQQSYSQPQSQPSAGAAIADRSNGGASIYSESRQAERMSAPPSEGLRWVPPARLSAPLNRDATANDPQTTSAYSVTRPQPPEKPQQIILEWSRQQ